MRDTLKYPDDLLPQVVPDAKYSTTCSEATPDGESDWRTWPWLPKEGKGKAWLPAGHVFDEDDDRVVFFGGADFYLLPKADLWLMASGPLAEVPPDLDKAPTWTGVSKFVIYTHYWFVALDDPLYSGQKHPDDWAEHCALQWVAEEPEARSIVRSCGWAVMVREKKSSGLPPRLPDFPGLLVAHCGVDNLSDKSLTLGVAAFQESVSRDFGKQ
jgi:hypothetical protein